MEVGTVINMGISYESSDSKTISKE